MPPPLLFLLLLPSAAWAAPHERIINGTAARTGEFPAMVSLWFRGRFYCGGTLLDAETVLSAAHCFAPRFGPRSRPRAWLARLGPHKYRGPMVRLRRVLLHPAWRGWRPGGARRDLALLKLSRRQPESRGVRYALLPDPDRGVVARDGPGDRCLVVGFGSTRPGGGGGSARLLKGAMRVISAAECRAGLGLGRSVMCAVSGHVATSACKGDSGGPLLCRPEGHRGGRLVQVGVVSVGKVPCGMPGQPVAFERVESNLGWIRRHLERGPFEDDDEDWLDL